MTQSSPLSYLKDSNRIILSNIETSDDSFDDIPQRSHTILNSHYSRNNSRSTSSSLIEAIENNVPETIDILSSSPPSSENTLIPLPELETKQSIEAELGCNEVEEMTSAISNARFFESPSSDEEKVIHESRTSLYSRQIENCKRINVKIEGMKKHFEAIDMQECVFKPHLSARTNRILHHRSPKQVPHCYQSSNSRLMKWKQHTAEEHRVTNSPVSLSSSRDVADNHVMEFFPSPSSFGKSTSPFNPFSPKINRKKISNQLYKDAERRREHRQKLQELSYRLSPSLKSSPEAILTTAQRLHGLHAHRLAVIDEISRVESQKYHKHSSITKRDKVSEHEMDIDSINSRPSRSGRDFRHLTLSRLCQSCVPSPFPFSPEIHVIKDSDAAMGRERKWKRWFIACYYGQESLSSPCHNKLKNKDISDNISSGELSSSLSVTHPSLENLSISDTVTVDLAKVQFLHLKNSSVGVQLQNELLKQRVPLHSTEGCTPNVSTNSTNKVIDKSTPMVVTWLEFKKRLRQLDQAKDSRHFRWNTTIPQYLPPAPPDYPFQPFRQNDTRALQPQKEKNQSTQDYEKIWERLFSSAIHIQKKRQLAERLEKVDKMESEARRKLIDRMQEEWYKTLYPMHKLARHLIHHRPAEEEVASASEVSSRYDHPITVENNPSEKLINRPELVSISTPDRFISLSRRNTTSDNYSQSPSYQVSPPRQSHSSKVQPKCSSYEIKKDDHPTSHENHGSCGCNEMESCSDMLLLCARYREENRVEYCVEERDREKNRRERHLRGYGKKLLQSMLDSFEKPRSSKCHF